MRVAQAPSGPHGGMPRDLKQQKSGPPPVFFPLGYKEAVYQWVCASNLSVCPVSG